MITNKYTATFKNKVTVLPVIHCKDLEHTLYNVELCVKYNAPGIFLINHGIKASELYSIYKTVRLQFPKLWIGLNFLGLESIDVFTIYQDETIDGIWVDDAGIVEDGIRQTVPETILYAQEVADWWKGLYFGGVAFKYQLPVDDYTKVTKIAKEYMDVITTSGDGTGQAADVNKIIEMNKAAEGTPLAIASGITVDNIDKYWDYASCFLVATGISKDFYNLDEELLRNLLIKTEERNKL